MYPLTLYEVTLSAPLEDVLSQVARKGSWYGGGTVAAISLGLSAALLEKLTHQPKQRKQLQQLWHRSLALAEEDARVFARVIAATRTGQQHLKANALKQAINVPYQVYAGAVKVQVMGQRLQRTIQARLQSDVRCAIALARAAQQAAAAFIHVNLAWLDDQQYTRMMQRRLKTLSTHARHA